MPLVAAEDWSPQGVADLEPRAWEALRENSRSVSVTAGAGAGKTEFLAQKAAFLLQTGLCRAPRRILAISFKCDAARNLAERVDKRCSSEQARRFDSYTFDAFTKSFLDRFRLAIPGALSPPADYCIEFPTARDYRDFLTDRGFHGVNATELESAIARTPLPLDEKSGRFLKAFWHHQYKRKHGVRLTFPMINRLVHLLLRENPDIRRALQATYPFIFLDEFQDTTHAQFELLQTAFAGSNAAFTAVGDDKQRIMGWAGAMPKAFDEFEKKFQAHPISLISNWRSHRDLVRIQHVVAERINPRTSPAEARGVLGTDGDIAGIWQYPTSTAEASGLARWIANEIAAGVAPHEIAILVRMHADSVEGILAEPMAKRGVQLRNVARYVAGITIQDVLTEELTQIVLPLLRLGSVERDAEAWNSAQNQLQFLEGVYPHDGQRQQRVQERLAQFIRNLRLKMREANPANEAACQKLASLLLDFVGFDKIRRAFPNYRRQQDCDRAWNGFLTLLSESAVGAASWCEVIDRFVGLGQVPLMTVHKSKGLEFHTILFYGLDNKTWWSLTPDRGEELNSFFVALTRAKQRAFFTFSDDCGRPVKWIEELLAPAGVQRISGPT